MLGYSSEVFKQELASLSPTLIMKERFSVHAASIWIC